MSKTRKSLVMVTVLLAVVAFTVGVVAAEGKSDLLGLVFIDDNMNGVWDPGEAGYGGVWMYDDVREMERYVGTTITIETPSYEEFTFESAGYRPLREDEKIACSSQDTLVDDDPNPDPQRPCSGTWGWPRVENDTYLFITLTVPEGYEATSETELTYFTGEDSGFVDFGIAPVEE